MKTSKIETLSLTAERQFAHGVALIREAERIAETSERRHELAGLASALTGIWRAANGEASA